MPFNKKRAYADNIVFLMLWNYGSICLNPLSLLLCSSPHQEEGQVPKPETLEDNSDMHVLDFEPTLKTLAICRILELGLDISMLPCDVK